MKRRRRRKARRRKRRKRRSKHLLSFVREQWCTLYLCCIPKYMTSHDSHYYSFMICFPCAKFSRFATSRHGTPGNYHSLSSITTLFCLTFPVQFAESFMGVKAFILHALPRNLVLAPKIGLASVCSDFVRTRTYYVGSIQYLQFCDLCHAPKNVMAFHASLRQCID